MNIERTQDEILMRLSSQVDIAGVQELVDYLEYKEATSKSHAIQ